MSEGPKRRTRWYVLPTMIAGTLLGDMLAPACGPGCVAKWTLAGTGIGLVIGLIRDAKNRPRLTNSEKPIPDWRQPIMAPMSDDPDNAPFFDGQRVRIVGHWEFADGIPGTVDGHGHTVQALKGPILCYFIIFDKPADDGSDDGPYKGAMIEADYLEPTDIF